MDKTASDLVYIISNSNNVKRRSEAVQTLLAIAPSLDEESITKILRDMMYIISNSDNDGRRVHAREVLIPLKLIQGG
jgi:hypothetical protein